MLTMVTTLIDNAGCDNWEKLTCFTKKKKIVKCGFSNIALGSNDLTLTHTDNNNIIVPLFPPPPTPCPEMSDTQTTYSVHPFN